jgi:hypothetical protein
MILLTKATTGTLILTLAEKQTITDANFLFVFTSHITNEVISFVLVSSADVSTNKERWNEFTIVVNTYFGNYGEGWYTYSVYEQESAVDTDPTGLTEVESGLMFLSDGSEPTTTQYDNSVTFKTYDAG